MSILELTRVRNELAASDDLLRQAIEALRKSEKHLGDYGRYMRDIQAHAGVINPIFKAHDATRAVLTAYDKRGK